MFCEGQLLPISENETLFNLIGTTYGGDGQTTFALPDLRGRVPLHFGSGFTLAETGGVETVTLTVSQIPAHAHPMQASTGVATSADPTNGFPAEAPLATTFPYGTDAPLTPLGSNAVGVTGGSQPHTNFQPYLCVDFIISLFGIFPSQT
jgi:microcystin-dependent protein